MHSPEPPSEAAQQPAAEPANGGGDAVPFTDDVVRSSVGHRFLEIAERFGEHPALRSPHGSWTFDELRRDVLRRAAGIDELVGRPDPPRPVALLMDHDGPLVVAILAVALSGHIVVVLDPQAPAEQSAEALEESAAALLVHDASQRELAAGHAQRCAIVAIDDLAGPGDEYEPPRRQASDPLMLAFTSGTSGASKAAVVTHGVLLNLVRGATEVLAIGPSDRMPMLFPASLAVAAYPLFLPLLNGGTLATLDVRGVGLAPVGEFLGRERITVLYMAPTVVRFLAGALEGTFPDLRLVALGGELVDADAVQVTRELFDPEQVANGFGTTETGVITLHLLDRGDRPDPVVPAGQPVRDVEVQIVDDVGEPVPSGTAGEVAVVSPYVFAGYWGHPELTAQVLEADPAGRRGWSRYRTGDIGRLDEQGALTVLGRLDTKVKVRGRFVTLGDVEADLRDLPGVADAVVTTVTTAGITELLATVTPVDGPLDPAGLRAQLLSVRESFRVPSRWNVVDELPRLPNGKVDRRAVRGAFDGSVPAADRRRPDDDATPMSSDQTARAIREVWEVLLPGALVGPDDDFFHLGGDSLLAAQMLVMVEQATGVTVPMGELLHARTVRSLAEVVRRASADGDASQRSTVACVQAGDEEHRPRLWFVHDLQGSAYRVRHVARELGEDQPVWSFESPLLRGGPSSSATLQEFVGRYVADLRAEQPQGPYWLAGYSFGGICAYEMARQLRHAGEEVAFTAVIDVGPGYRGPGWGGRRAPFRPWFGVAKPPPPGASRREAFDHYRRLVRESPRRALRHLMVRTGIAERVDPFRFRADLRRHGRVRPEWRLWYAWNEHWRLAATAWDRGSRYDGRVDLFWADETPSDDASLGWAPLVADLEIHRFRGDHEGILEPRGAGSLAAALRPVLDDALRRRASDDGAG